jgi:predicted 3-demethylubiquinone-9 3-methyltransferase (glyoxalase superfamily)
MQKITPFLWFDTQAEEAMNYYLSVFKNSKAKGASRYGEAGPGPKGSVMTATFELEGQEFIALNGGPAYARFSQAISFFVNCRTADEVDGLWAWLSQGGTPMMELGEYPFSKRYGWIKDKYGLSWQLILGLAESEQQKIVPCLLFVGEKYGKAMEAMTLYTSTFPDASIKMVHKGEPGEAGTEPAVQFAAFTLFGQSFAAMDGMGKHEFTFTPAVSLFVTCETQEEVDKYWRALTANGGREVQCGWLEDKFRVSWQIIPKALMDFMSDPDAKRSQRVMQAMLKMKKIEIAGLERAYKG